MVDHETETAVGKTCLVSDRPDEGRTKRRRDEDTPDRPFPTDDVDARAYLPSTQTPGRSRNEDDPRVLLLDCPERTLLAPSERAGDPSGACESLGRATRVA